MAGWPAASRGILLNTCLTLAERSSNTVRHVLGTTSILHFGRCLHLLAPAPKKPDGNVADAEEGQHSHDGHEDDGPDLVRLEPARHILYRGTDADSLVVALNRERVCERRKTQHKESSYGGGAHCGMLRASCL